MTAPLAACRRQPTRCVIHWDKVPDFLIAHAHWVLWRRESLAACRRQFTKVPYQPDRRKASSTNRGTWSDWETVQIAFDRDGDADKFFDGIGFVLTAELGMVGWDFDHCYSHDTGWIHPTVAHYLSVLNSYTEITPGGDGLRVFTFGKLPLDGRKRADFPASGIACECYSAGRYLTITGARL